jgi:hypothetical protein
MNLRPRHNIRIASVLLINNQHAPRPSHLTLTSHLHTYISSLYLHLYYTAYTASTASTASIDCLKRLPTPLPLLPRSTAYPAASTASIDCLKRLPTPLPLLPQAHSYYCQIRASSAYFLLPNSSLKRIPTILPTLPNSISPGEKSFNCAVLILFHSDRAFTDH